MKHILATAVLALSLTTCSNSINRFEPPPSENPPVAEIKSPEIRRLLEGAINQIKITREYTQDYMVISYPNGDPPSNTGACTDVVIRGFRSAGIDLQKEVHEDMRANFSAYPNKWGLTKTDTNIDHRRVPNLQTFFARKGKSVGISRNADDYRPGDIVPWDINGRGMTHIGLVSNLKSARTRRHLVIHNIGAGVNAEDRLFDWTITGHYRYF